MITTLAAVAAVAVLGVTSPSQVSQMGHPAENPECPAIARTIEHGLAHLGNRADDYRAAVATDDYLPAGRWLNRWVGEVGGAFQLYSIGADGAPPMRQGLAHIARLCPDAHAG